ncbi:hypothetical protein GCM10008969_56700 [Pseudomonas veronii subsp. inensis]
MQALRLVAEQLIERAWDVLAQLHRDPVRTDLQQVAIVQAHCGIATQWQVMAIGVSAATAVDHAETSFDDPYFAMMGLNAVVAILQAPIRRGTADAATLWTKPVTGQIPVQQLRGIADNQRQLHARPRIRTTVG